MIECKKFSNLAIREFTPLFANLRTVIVEEGSLGDQVNR